jgi:hypothetical protein
MEINSVPAVFGMNGYLWSQIQAGSILSPSDYGGLIPIIPIQQEPQLITAIEAVGGISSAPYIVYSWYNAAIDANSWYRPTDMVVYSIYSLDQLKLRQLYMLMFNLFSKFDVSAQAVNKFVQGSSMSAEAKQYNYNFISVSAGMAGQPQQVENAPYRATLTLRVNYTNPSFDEPLP